MGFPCVAWRYAMRVHPTQPANGQVHWSQAPLGDWREFCPITPNVSGVPPQSRSSSAAAASRCGAGRGRRRLRRRTASHSMLMRAAALRVTLSCRDERESGMSTSRRVTGGKRRIQGSGYPEMSKRDATRTCCVVSGTCLHPRRGAPQHERRQSSPGLDHVVEDGLGGGQRVRAGWVQCQSHMCHARGTSTCIHPHQPTTRPRWVENLKGHKHPFVSPAPRPPRRKPG